MKRLLRLVGGLVGGFFLVILGIAFFSAQRADYGWQPQIDRPTFVGELPRVLVDESHNNASSVRFTGRYWPFGCLLRADGYAIERSTTTFSRELLDDVDVLIIANAAGSPKPQIFGLNVPFPARGRRSDPAFTPGEIEIIHSWVIDGGSLLLIADHAPFGEAVADLSAALGVTMHKGFVEVPEESSDPLLFSTENGRLGDHAIIRGTGQESAVHRVMTFTGQSLDGPPGSVVLLRLPSHAIEYVPRGEELVEVRAGEAQGVALELGAGRVVVLGEGGMVTAQVSRRAPYGINMPGNENARFVRNVMSWLTRKL